MVFTLNNRYLILLFLLLMTACSHGPNGARYERNYHSVEELGRAYKRDSIIRQAHEGEDVNRIYATLL